MGNRGIGKYMVYITGSDEQQWPEQPNLKGSREVKVQHKPLKARQ